MTRLITLLLLASLSNPVPLRAEISAPSEASNREFVSYAPGSVLRGAPHDSGPSRQPVDLTADIGGAPPPEGAVGPITVNVTRSGTWAYANRSHGSGYLAIPEGPGWHVLVCGPLGCLDRVSTDAGPELWLQRAGRIGDLSAVMFEEVCGPLSAGLCDGSYTITGQADQHPEDPPEHPDDERMRLEDGGPNPTLPPTDGL